MNKKISIFPIDHNTVTFVRHAHLGEFEPIALITPTLKVLEGNDISKLDGGFSTNILLYADYKSKIADSDSVCFIESKTIQNNDDYNELIEYAKSLGKEIIISHDLLKRLDPKMKKTNDEQTLFLKENHSLKLKPIEVPIISLLAIGENCGQPQTEMSIREYFLSKDYKVVQIGTQQYSNLLGCLNFPMFLLDPTIDIEKKILMFNNFIYSICQIEKPDLIILGVPNPIIKYNDEILNGLGIVPFIIQNAVKADIGVVNLHYGEYTHEYLTYITEFCKYRLEIPTKYFSISNTSAYKSVDDIEELEFLHLNIDFVKANLNTEIGKDDYTIFATYDNEGTKNTFQKMENELLTNLDKI